MCGIFGGINLNIDSYDKAKSLLSHRGPDQTGEFSIHPFYLYHARLGILDISNGKQPMSYLEFTIAFNGEIFNHRELRSRYGIQCETNSDTETLVKLYALKGRQILEELDGMFAFTIYDSIRGLIFLARDRAGEKPLYYYNDSKTFAFSSELNCLRSLINPKLNYDMFHQYLRFGLYGSNTPYLDVFELEHGTWMELDVKTLRHTTQKWWSISDNYEKKFSRDGEDIMQITESLLFESVGARLGNSDLEVGAFLSGGIDSGLITAMASKIKPGIKTFTVSFPGQFDESLLAEQVSRKYNTNHTVLKIDFSDLKTNLEKILVNYGEPFSDSSAIPSYYVSREAKKHLTVILNGDGADELFGGYRRYVPFKYNDFFIHSETTRSLAAGISRLMPFPDAKRSNYAFLFRIIEMTGKLPLSRYLSSTYDYFEGFEGVFYNGHDQLKELSDSILLLNDSGMSGLKKIMCLDFDFQFSTHLAVKMDIATMANSLEARAPFLSKEILEFAPTIPDRYKIKGIETKHILRNIAKKYLTPEVANAPKRGFEIPLRKWIEGELNELCFDYLSPSRKTFSENFVHKKFINDLLASKIKTYPEKRAKMIWVFLALEIWHEKCFLSR